jgi:hypothetical protein
MTKTVTLRLDRFGREALDEYVRTGPGTYGSALETAVRYYLGDSGSGRAAWPVPTIAGDPDSGEPLGIEIDSELHQEVRHEADRQEVTPDLLALHALLYFLVDRDSGRASGGRLRQPPGARRA